MARSGQRVIKFSCASAIADNRFSLFVSFRDFVDRFVCARNTIHETTGKKTDSFDFASKVFSVRALRTKFSEVGLRSLRASMVDSDLEAKLIVSMH
jgi:hypothetical protein